MAAVYHKGGPTLKNAVPQERPGPGREKLPLQTSFVRMGVNILGAVVLAAYSALTLLSYVQAPALWRNHPAAPHAVAFFAELGTHFPLVALGTMFETSAAVIVSHYVPLAVVTLASIVIVLMLYRRERTLDDSIATLLMRWSIAFAAVNVLAFPVFTQDFWLSMVWGRMAAEGTNPYHNLFTDETLVGLPLDHFPMVMSYGPAWAIVSGAVMAVTGSNVLAAAILFKGLLLAVWLASLVLIGRITASKPALDRCLAVTVAGWMPLGLLQTVAEGHNDIFMVWLALLWVALMNQARWLAPYALVVSALSKYVTAPLFLVDAIVAWRRHGLSWRQLILRLVGPGLLGLAVFGVFFRSPEFFEGTRVISEWEFLQPRHAVEAIEIAIGIPLSPVEHLIAAGFALLVIGCLVALFKSPTPDNAVKAALAIMCAVSLVAIAHLWPWYLVWTIALAALLPRWWLARFVIGVSIMAPFTLAFWWVEPVPDSREWASLGLYVGAILWCVLTRPAVATGGPKVAHGPKTADPLAARDA